MVVITVGKTFKKKKKKTFGNGPISYMHLGTTVSLTCEVWGVGGKGRGSSLQEGTSHTYTLKLC